MKNIIFLCAFTLAGSVPFFAFAQGDFEFRSPRQIHAILRQHPELTTAITSWSLAYGKPINHINRMVIRFSNMSETYTPDDNYPTLTKTRQHCRIEAQVWPTWEFEEASFMVRYTNKSNGCLGLRLQAGEIARLRD